MFYIRLSKVLCITNHNESYIRLKAGNKYSKHISSWSKGLRNFRLKLQDREDKIKKKPTAYFDNIYDIIL